MFDELLFDSNIFDKRETVPFSEMIFDDLVFDTGNQALHLKAFVGGVWTPGVLKIWENGAWVPARLNVRIGSSWTKIH